MQRLASDQYFLHLFYANCDAKRSTIVSLLCSTQNHHLFDNNNNNNDNNKDKSQHILFVNEPQKLTYHIVIAIKELCQYQAWLVNTFQILKVPLQQQQQ
ncbi:hypothetical protein RFI_03365, partial [Reticulomyxa filosa]